MSPLSHCISTYFETSGEERKKKEEEQFASTRPVGFAAGKNILNIGFEFGELP